MICDSRRNSLIVTSLAELSALQAVPSCGLIVSAVVAAKSLLVPISVCAQVVRVVGLLVIAAARAGLTITLAVAQTLLEIIHANGAFDRLVRWNVPVSVFVTVAVGEAVIGIVWLPVVGAASAVLAVVLAVAQSLLEIFHGSALFVALTGWNVPVAVFIAVAIGAEVIGILGLPVIAAIATILAVVLAVLQALLEKPAGSMFVFVAVLVLVAILVLALLRGNPGNKTGRAKPGEGHSECQHPY